MQYPVRNYPEVMPGELGYAWVPMAMAAAQAYAQSKNQDGEGGGGATQTEQNPGMPGTNPSAPRQPSSMTTVSPTIQASISPQISPTMSQVQSSPGASISAAPMQYMPGGQSARGGGTTDGVSPWGNYAAPGMPSGPPGVYPAGGSGFSPMSPYTLDPMTGQYVPLSSTYIQPGGYGSPVHVGGSSMTDIPWIPIALIAGGGALIFYLTKRRRKT